MFSHVAAERNKQVHTTPLGEGKWKLEAGAWSLLDTALCTFSIADFNGCLFLVVNCNCDYNGLSEF